jgi:hypothetical protein
MYKHITRYRYIRNPKPQRERGKGQGKEEEKKEEKKRGTAGSLACESK